MADEEELLTEAALLSRRRAGDVTAPRELLEAHARDMPVEPDDAFGQRSRVIAENESEYNARRHNRKIGPMDDKVDAYTAAQAGKRATTASTAGAGLGSTYAAQLLLSQVGREEAAFRKLVAEQAAPAPVTADVASTTGKRSRWDMAASAGAGEDEDDHRLVKKPKSGREEQHEAPAPVSQPATRRSRWDAAPVSAEAAAESTPAPALALAPAPAPAVRRSRWDESPAGETKHHASPAVVAGGGGGGKLAPVVPSMAAPMTIDALHAARAQRSLDERNRPLSDEDLDALLPTSGYQIVEPPAGYLARAQPRIGYGLSVPPPDDDAAAVLGYQIPSEIRGEAALASADVQPGDDSLPVVKPEDYQYFARILNEKPGEQVSFEEAQARRISRLLLKIKNGEAHQRKVALRQITDRAIEFGPGPLFNQILPLLMSPTLEDAERHVLVKVIDRVLYKLDDAVRPYTHELLVVIAPMLIYEDYFARVEGREIISNLAKAAGLATMIATMRPDIDHADEFVRNTTARAFAVVASALGIPALLPFLKAVCKTKKSWEARHTGIRIVQHIAMLMGCGVLPHLRQLVETISAGISDEHIKVRTMTALSLAALAEAAAPYGIESFDAVISPLWKGVRTHPGKALAAFIKAIGCLVPLMDAEYANYYTREVMAVLVVQFQTADEDMKRIVLKVIKQCIGTDGVEPAFVRAEILPEFFMRFWVRRMALDKRNYSQLVATTVELAKKVGASEIISHLVNELKDSAEGFRKMAVEAIRLIIDALGTADIDLALETRLVDGMIFAFQEQTLDDRAVLLGLGKLVSSLGVRAKPYIAQLCAVIRWRLNNRSPKVRQQSADLIGEIAAVMVQCDEEAQLSRLGVILYEYFGEEYPEVLGSILGALRGIVSVLGMTRMQPPIKDLLPRLTPIMRNRHEKVQENCIDLVGRIAERGASFVSPREWMRISFELLEMLKAPRKAIRRAAVATFGYIARAIGPQDVLATLLNNLRVQERQMRVATTVAIAIVAEVCSPFTVLPALMNEYKVPEANIQNGVLKALSFMFEYVGEMGRDYIYSVLTLLEDALTDRDQVHRQTAAVVVKHAALGVYGLSCEDAAQHLLNFVWPNIFETSPHVINAVMDAIEACRMSLGAGVVLLYCLQGLFHPARRVREVYWRIFNSAYMGSPDSLVAAYPRVANTPRNHYVRDELDYFL